MKSIILIITVSFCIASCGKKYDYVCEIINGGAAQSNKVTYENIRTTENGAIRYENEHSVNDNGVDYLIGKDEIQVTCTKK
jgi:hypothetical protein